MKDEIKAFLDGELDPSATVEVQRELDQSDEARAIARDFERISDSIRAATPPVSVRGYEDTLLALASREQARRRNWGRWFPRLALAGIGAVAVGALALNQLNLNDPTKQATPASKALMAAHKEFGTTEGVDRGSTGQANLGAAGGSEQLAFSDPAGTGLGGPDGSASTQRAPIERAPGQPPLMALDPTPATSPTPAPTPPMSGTPAPVPANPFRMPTDPLPSALTGEVVPIRPEIPPGEMLSNIDPAVLRKRIETLTKDRSGRIVRQQGDTILVSVPATGAASLRADLLVAIASAGTVSEPVAPPEPAVAAKSAANVPAELRGQSREQLQTRRQELVTKRSELLTQFYDDAKPVKEVDQQIRDVDAALQALDAPSGLRSDQRLITIVLRRGS